MVKLKRELELKEVIDTVVNSVIGVVFNLDFY